MNPLRALAAMQEARNALEEVQQHSAPTSDLANRINRIDSDLHWVKAYLEQDFKDEINRWAAAMTLG